MNSYSTTSLPIGTVTQTWNINEALRNTKKLQKMKETASVPALPVIRKSNNVLTLPIPQAIKQSTTSNHQDARKPKI